MTARNRRIAWRESARLVLAVLMGVLVVTGARAADPAQKSFATPDDAVNALVQAVKARDRNAMLAALGNAGDWLSSGDATADKATVERFLSDYQEKHTIVRDGDFVSIAVENVGFADAGIRVVRGARY